MASDVRAVVAYVKTTLQGVNGAAGGYTYDLSDTADRVVIGGIDAPTMVPQVYVQDWSLSSEPDHVLGRYRRTLAFLIWGYVGADSQTPGDRALAATDLLDDVATALEADRTFGGLVLDVIVKRTTAIDGLELGMDNLGAFGIDVEVFWSVYTGA